MSRRCFLLVIGSLLLIGAVSASYTSQYPPLDTYDYVNATSDQTDYEAYHVTDNETALNGTATGNAWVTAWGTNQSRLHIDLGSVKVIERIYYENFALSGGNTDIGAKNFTFWGSNESESFLALTYANDTGWTSITAEQLSFDVHDGSDTEDPKYINLTNSDAFRYYAIKIVNTWGNANLLGMRRVELQTEDGGEEPPAEDPYADFISDSLSGPEPQIISFTDLSFGDPDTWTWNRTDVTGNNTPLTFSTDQSPKNVTFMHGNWSIDLTVSNSYGTNTSPLNTVFANVTTLAPIAAFSANVTSGIAPLQVGFSDNTTFISSGEHVIDGSFESGGSEWTFSYNASVSSTDPYSGIYSARFANGGPPDAEEASVMSQTIDFTGVSQIGFWSHGDGDGIYVYVDGDSIGTKTTTGEYSYAAFNVSYEGTHLLTFIGSLGSSVMYIDDVTAISSGSGEPTGWDWYWSDDETKDSDEQNPTVSLPAGIYNVRLYVSNSGGGDWENKTSYINAIPRATAFVANITSGLSPLPVTFTDTSEGTPDDWDWYWFDNETKSSDDQNPSTSFTTGLYSIRLYTSVGGGEGDWENKTSYINATTIVAPTTNFEANVTSGITPLHVGLTDLSTDDPTDWDWYFGNGTKFSDDRNTSVILTPGTYTINLYASNAGGGDWENKTDYITVTNETPVAAFSANVTSGTTPLHVGFTDSSTNTPTGWSWRFGNGTVFSTAQNPAVTLTPGTYTIDLYASNDGGGDWENKTNYITVTNVTPVAGFTANVTSGTTPLAVTFTDSSTNVPTNWDWYWSSDEVKDSDEQNPSTIFTTGTHSVRLYAANDGGGTWMNRSDYITVNPAPTPTPTPTVTHSREMAVATIATIPGERYESLMEILGIGANMTNETPNWSAAPPEIVGVYTDYMGPIAFLLIFLIPFGMVWMSHGNMKLLSILGIITGLFVFQYLPQNYVAAAVMCIGVSIAAGLWGVFKQ